MAIYRNVMMNFWTDAKVLDDFTPEDRYFYLYLLTNPHTNLSGCYEMSLKSASTEMGYNRETIEKLLKRFEQDHDAIRYDPTTKEVLILNWHRYNWTSSEKFRKPLLAEIENIKNADFRVYLMDLFEEKDTVAIPYQYGSDTTDTVTDTDTVKKNSNGRKKSTSRSALNSEFDSLWILYPRKQGKDKAQGYYERARKAGTTYEEVEAGILAYKAYIEAEQIDKRYVKQGSTFFSQKAWQDDWSVSEKSSDDAFEQAMKAFMEGAND